MLNQLVRYYPVIEDIRKGRYGTVCEIGSGCHGITKFYNNKVYGVDINFHDYSFSRQLCNPNLSPVIADALKLPFKDNEFDLVFSCDMLEHVKADERMQVISEMVRVAIRKIIIMLPCGGAALESEKRLEAYYNYHKKQVPLWLKEHLSIDFPEFEKLHYILKKINLPYKLAGNENIYLHNAIIKAESHRKLERILSGISLYYSDYRKPIIPAVLINLILRIILKCINIKPTYRIYIEINKL